MFLGHFALGFAAKKVEPTLSLGTALVAAQIPDVIWPYLVLAGAEDRGLVWGHRYRVRDLGGLGRPAPRGRQPMRG